MNYLFSNPKSNLSRSLSSTSSSSSSSPPPLENIDRTDIPGAEDRKRFLTCLALILTNYCYDYDYMKNEEQQQIDDDELSDHLILKQQYRKRRHCVASNLLIKCTEYLGLPHYEAQRWLPILQNILTPISEEKRKKNTILTSSTVNTVTTSTIITKNNSNDDDDNDVDNNNNKHSIVKKQQQQSQFSWKIHRNELVQDDDFLKSELEKMTPDAGYRCLCLVLFQYLLQSEQGYDARVRVAFKRLAVTLFVHNAKCCPIINTDGDDDDDFYGKNVSWATRKFESLEQTIADRILNMAQTAEQQQQQSENINGKNSRLEAQKKNENTDFDNLVRGLKVGTAGVVAGTLLVVTGGMAAPAIAGGLGLIGLGVLGAHLLAASTVVITLFGAAGGGLAMYKMNRRTAGLTEFIFQPSPTAMAKQKQQEAMRRRNSNAQQQQQQQYHHVAELARTICISGWLRDQFDFQRSWGVTPNFFRNAKDKKNKTILLELLERFYAVHNPELVRTSRMILAQNDWNKGNKLWDKLEEKYGVNPTNVFPLKYGPKIEAELTSNEEQALNNIFSVATIIKDNPEGEIKLDNNENDEEPQSKKNSATTYWKDYLMMKENTQIKNIDEIPDNATRSSTMSSSLKKLYNATSMMDSYNASGMATSFINNFTLRKTKSEEQLEELKLDIKEQINQLEFENEEKEEETSSVDETSQGSRSGNSENDNNSLSSSASDFPSHLSTAWDYHANYGGELYTVQWESGMLLELCRCVADLALDMANTIGREALKLTVASPLIMATVLPNTVLSSVNSIDEPWNLAIERSDAAGKELARILLSNCAGGRRPVTLVGYSFGARMIISCLKELARYQIEWEENKLKHEKEAEAEAEMNHPRSPDCDDKKHQKQKKNKKKKIKNEKFNDVEPACIVEDVILMGLPKYLGGHKSWEVCRSIVSGRLVNVYSRNDKILSLLFKYKRMLKGGLLNRAVCGNCPIRVGGIAGVENIDVSDIVVNHSDYCLVAGEILKRIRHGQPLRYCYDVHNDEDDFGDGDDHDDETTIATTATTRKFTLDDDEDDELILGWASEKFDVIKVENEKEKKKVNNNKIFANFSSPFLKKKF